MIGYHALGDTVLAKRMGARSRVAPIVTGAILATFGILGARLVGFVPRLVVGAFLVTVGGGLLLDWIRDFRRVSDPTFRVITLIIVVTMGSVGILEGIGLGLVLTCILFVVRYSRVDPVRRASNGYRARSRADRTPAELDALREVAEGLLVLELHGYLFFGSLTQLDDTLRQAIESDDPPFAIVLDFARVSGIDRSGYRVLARSADEARQVGARLYACGLSDAVSQSLDREGPGSDTLIVSDHGLERLLESLENQLLADRPPTSEPSSPTRAMSEELRAAFELLEVSPGDLLIEQGTDGDELFVVVSGRLAVSHNENGESTRLRTVGPATAIGETALLGGYRRIADITAEEPSEVLRLRLATYEQLRHDQPLVALELMEYLLAQQSMALRKSTDLVLWAEG